MGKIWLKSTDPTKQCCGCEGKSGPCSTCCTRVSGYTVTNVYQSGAFKDKLMKAAWTGGTPIVGTDQSGALVFSNTGTKLTFISDELDSAQVTYFSPPLSGPQVYWGYPDQFHLFADLVPPYYGTVNLTPWKNPARFQIQFNVNEGEYVKVSTTMLPPTIDVTQWKDFQNYIPAFGTTEVAITRESRKESSAYCSFGGNYRLFSTSGITTEEYYSATLGSIETNNPDGAYEAHAQFVAVSGLTAYYDVVDGGFNPANYVAPVCRGFTTMSGAPDAPFNGGGFYGPDASGIIYDTEARIPPGFPINIGVLIDYHDTIRSCGLTIDTEFHVYGLSLGYSPFAKISPYYALSTLVGNSYVIERIHPGFWNGNPPPPQSFLFECEPPLPTFDGTEVVNVGITGTQKFRVNQIKKHLIYTPSFPPFTSLVTSAKTMCATFEGTHGSTLELFDTGNKPISIVSRLRPYATGLIA